MENPPKRVKKQTFLLLKHCIDVKYLSYFIENVMVSLLCTYDSSHTCPLDLGDILGLLAYTINPQNMEIRILLIWIIIQHDTKELIFDKL